MKRYTNHAAALVVALSLFGIPLQAVSVSKSGMTVRAEESETCEHNYSNGFCVECGEPQPNYVKPGADGYYNLSDAHEMLWWSRAVAAQKPNASARLTADIDMEGITMTPIGSSEANSFRGTFDGQGHVISNLVISGESNIGLFGYVTGGAYVKNFILDSSCSISGASYCGTIGCSVGGGSINIEGIGMEGAVTATGINAGGVLGCCLGGAILMSDCYVTGKVIGASESGALSGWVGGVAKLSNLWACGEVEGMDGESYLYRGGTESFENCFAVKGNQGKIITEEQIANGALTFMLNKEVVENPVWHQTLGSDDYPTLNRTHGVVFQLGDDDYSSLASEDDIAGLASVILQNVSNYCSEKIAEQALLDAYQEQAKGLAQCKEISEFCTKYTQMRNELKGVEYSSNVYSKYMARCAEIKAYLDGNADLVGEGVESLRDYLEGEDAPSASCPLGGYGYVTEHHVATAEQIEAEIARLNKLFDAALTGSYVPGQDITSLLANPDFSLQPAWTGWAGVTGSGMQTVRTKDGKEYVGAESWQKVMDMYQTLSGLRPGYYLVSMNGAYRHHNDRYSNAYSAQFYAGDNNVYLPSVYETRISAEEAEDDVNCNISGEGTIDLPIYEDWSTSSEASPVAYALHGMPGMGYAVASGRAKNHIVAYVGQEGKLTFGVRIGNNGSTGNWVGFGNFQLTYCGDATTEQTKEAVEQTLAEQHSRANTILNLYKVDDLTPEAAPNYPSVLKEALRQAYQTAEQASTLDEKLSCVGRYSELFNQINEGKVAYLSLYKNAGLLESAGTILKDRLQPEEYNEILNVSKSLYDAYADGAYTIEEALHPALLESEAIRTNIPEIDANGVIHIKNLSAMAFFSAYVNSGNTTASAKLEADIQGVTEEMVFTDFRGTLDGGYHTISMNINHAGENAGLIEVLGGTVRNLYLEGTITTDSKYAGGVAGTTGNSSATIQNVVCKVNIVSNVDGDGTHGGIVGCADSEATISNCLYAGTLSGEKTTCCGGFVGWLNSAVTINNSLLIGDITVNPSGGHTWARNPGNLTLNNSYYLKAHATAAGLQITSEQLVSGEACYFLNNSSNTASDWCQTLGIDQYPLPDPSHTRVGVTYEGTYTNDQSKFAVEHSGTKGDPYVLATVGDLERMHSKMRLGEITYFILNNDIDMSSVSSWTPLNVYEDAANGRNWQAWVDLDGRGHVIRNLKTSGKDYGSFFGVLCGNVRNIGFEDVDVDCSNTGSGVLGGYVGHTDYSDADRNLYTSCIENVWVTGKLKVSSSYCGGFFGNVGGPTVMRNCYANVEITSGASLTGGIIGRVRDALTMENCYVAGKINAGTWGGIVGGGQKGSTPATTYKNIVVWNNTDQNFGTTAANDKLDGILYYDGSNFRELQQAVVAWDANLWSCTMEDGAYPVLMQTAIGIQPVTDKRFANPSSGIYTLTGVRLTKANKGLYIIDGRKVLVK